MRAHVEHVFGHQHTSMGGTFVRTIGIVRDRAKIGFMNLVYNISWLIQLERMAAVPEPSARVESVLHRVKCPRDVARGAQRGPRRPLPSTNAAPERSGDTQSINTVEFSRCPRADHCRRLRHRS